MKRPTRIRSLVTMAVTAILFVLQASGGVFAQELPHRFTGEGIVLVVTEHDESSGKVAGTMQLKGDAALPLTVDLTLDADGYQKGKGRVERDGKRLRITTQENPDGSIQIKYRAKRYVVTLVEGVADPAPAARPSVKAASGSLRLRQHSFKDAGFNNQPSHTMLVPVGWKVEGGAYYFPEQFFKAMPTQEITLTSPEGVMLRVEPNFIAVDNFPPAYLGMQRSPEGSSDAGTPVIHYPGDLAGWKTSLEKKLLPATYPKAKNIKVLEVGLIPELTEAMRRQMEPLRVQTMQQQVMGDTTTFDAFVMGAESRYTLDGVDYEEVSIIALTVIDTENSTLGRTIFWTQDKGLTMRAPVGLLADSMSLLGTIASSVQMTEPWLKARAQRFAQVMKISAAVALNGAREAAKRSSIMSKAYSDAADISHAGYTSRSATSSDVHGRVIRSLDGSEMYSTGGSAPAVQLPSGYDNVFSNGNGEYLLTNDALLDPAVETTGNWTRMNSMDAR